MTTWFLSTCALIAALMLLRLILKGRMDPRLTYALWLLVALRVLIPVSLFQSPVSVDALAERTGAAKAVETAGKFLAPKYFQRMELDPPEDLSINGVNSFVRNLERNEMLLVYDVHHIGKDGVRLTAFAPPKGSTLCLAGGAVMLVVLAVSNGRFAARLRKRRRPYEGELPVECPLKVYVVDDLPSPCLFGFFKPAIYLNGAAVESDRLDHILTHELTHYRHGDQWWAVLRCLCLCVQWFNPLVWEAAYLSRQDCETACDTSAIKALGEGERIGYGKTLVNMIAVGRSAGSFFQTATTMTGGVKSIYRRVKLIAQKPKMTALTVAAVLLIAAVAVGCTFGGAGEKDPEDPAPPSSEPAEPSRTPIDGPSPAERAQAVFDAIVGTREDRSFLVSVNEGGSDDPLVEYSVGQNGYNVDHVGYYLSSFPWSETEEPLKVPDGYCVTLASMDQNTFFHCWEKGGLVSLFQNGSWTWLVSGPDSNGTTLYELMLVIAEDAALDYIWRCEVDHSVSDYDEVVRLYAQSAATELPKLPEWHRWRPLDAAVRGSGVSMAYLGEPENFCGWFGLYLKLEDGETSNWQAGSGMELIGSGPHAGYWEWGIGASFMRDEDGDWVCTGRYTGGEELVYPVTLEEATVEQLVDYFFHTVGETPHYYRIPLELRRRGLNDLKALNGILAKYSAEDARELCYVLGLHTAMYPEYENVTYETLAQILDEPYQSWLTEGYQNSENRLS